MRAEVVEVGLQLDELRAAYRSGEATPSSLVAQLIVRLADFRDRSIWIDRLSDDELRRSAAAIEERWPDPGDRPGLYGVPFAVKDNIDVRGRPTTAGCPDFAYIADDSAPIIDALTDAGALLVGKTNLDQFATGLTGARSPYGACRAPFGVDMISGGSSSGSALAVSLGLVTFAIGTDTAGSGRVPAAMNNIVGLKPSVGLVSSRGIVPACKSLDCASIFSLSVADGREVLAAIAGPDAEDPYSRPIQLPPVAGSAVDPSALTLAVPREQDLTFFGDDSARLGFAAAIDRWRNAGARVVQVDFRPFFEAAGLLYDGPWVAERYASLGDFLEGHSDAVLPVTARILRSGTGPSAVDAFRGFHRLAAIKSEVATLWQGVDALIVPTVPRAYTVAEVEADPIRLNSNLGTYTNFANLLDLAAVAVPSGFSVAGLPHGITILGASGRDGTLADLAEFYHLLVGGPVGATGRRLCIPSGRAATAMPDLTARESDRVLVAVVGAHLSGMPLNPDLVARGGRLLTATRTSASYRLFALAGEGIARPGLIRVGDASGCAVEVEIYDMPLHGLGSLMTTVPSPLAIGRLQLDDGSEVLGFVCEGYAADAAVDISDFGGWRAFQRAAVG